MEDPPKKWLFHWSLQVFSTVYKPDLCLLELAPEVVEAVMSPGHLLDGTLGASLLPEALTKALSVELYNVLPIFQRMRLSRLWSLIRWNTRSISIN
jgi:hypothetical protein